IVERDTVVSDTCERHFLPLSQGWERGLGGEGDSKPPYLVTHLDRAGRDRTAQCISCLKFAYKTDGINPHW
ncbi:hypothetical protein, partial [Spirulina sp. CS-785/01]|uniref:hypothetical protein n=1 Tax=Spirulina sp. CS-785/01 TaxID=3021716 RepID=UPI00232A7D03